MKARALILAHLGLALGCKRTEPIPEPVATSIPTATTAATATVSATATASATPSAIVSASASASTKPVVTVPITVTAGTKLPPGRCFTNTDCAGGFQSCGPSGVTGEPGYCRSLHVQRGRALVVDGASRVAALSESRMGAVLERAACDEHASIAAFARTICELMALGAPIWLLHETQQALADEIRHTEMTLAMLAGESSTLGPLPEASAPLKRDASELFRDVFRGGAVGETLATAQAERDRDEASDPQVRAFFDTIFRDEARHAALAFKTLRWLISEHPLLERVRDEEIARFVDHASFEERSLVTPLFSSLGVKDS